MTRSSEEQADRLAHALTELWVVIAELDECPIRAEAARKFTPNT